MQIGRFRIERILGKSGFGIMYLCHDEQLQRKVAIKVPKPQFVQAHLCPPSFESCERLRNTMLENFTDVENRTLTPFSVNTMQFFGVSSVKVRSITKQGSSQPPVGLTWNQLFARVDGHESINQPTMTPDTFSMTHLFNDRIHRYRA